MLLPVTLLSATAATFLNLWLGLRIGQFRGKFKVSVGDGGHEPLLRRMRAQANFIESAPFVLILIAGLEISGASRTGLGLIAAMDVAPEYADIRQVESSTAVLYLFSERFMTYGKAYGLCEWFEVEQFQNP